MGFVLSTVVDDATKAGDVLDLHNDRCCRTKVYHKCDGCTVKLIWWPFYFPAGNWYAEVYTTLLLTLPNL
jgi:hypothetical protein